MGFKDWDKLLYGIEGGECILFLGPELPAGATDGTPKAQLARRLLERMKANSKNLPGLDPDNLSQIAQRFVAIEDEMGLEMQVRAWHDELQAQHSALHEDLAALPFRMILTTSHDPLMEIALQQAGKSPTIGRYHYRGGEVRLASDADPTAESPLLYYLYGRVAEPDSLVLTETQLLDYLTKLISKNPALPHDVKAALSNGRLFLFLGFGLTRWYLRILLHVLKVLHRRGRAFAIENLEKEAVGQPLQDNILFYKDFKLDIYCQDVLEFVNELRKRYGPGAPGPNSGSGTAPAPLPSEEPTVFICHAGENSDEARRIHDALKKNGIQPWLDKETLRGGDEWDAMIESTIGEVDYFVILNSRALKAKTLEKSYVNKEINVAIRFADWRTEKKFIIPVLLDDTPPLKLIAKYQAVDLARPDGTRDLVRAIKREEGKR